MEAHYPNVQKLVLGQMYADVFISFTDAPGITVRVTSDTGWDKHFNFFESAQHTLKLSCPIPTDPIDHNPNQSTWSDDGRTLKYNGKIVDKTKKLTVQIIAPFGTEIEARDVYGKVSIADVPGSLKLTNSGFHAVEVGLVSTDAHINIKSSGAVNIAGVRGKAFIHNEGFGKCTVGDGHGLSAEILVESSGAVTFAGSLDHCYMANKGFGAIEIGEITGGCVTVNLSSSGGVTVDKGFIKKLEVTSSGFGNVDLGGCNIQEAKITTKSSGGADLGNMTGGNLTANVAGFGDVKVSSGKADQLTVVTRSSGSFRFVGTAHTGKFTAKGFGSIRVKHVETPPEITGDRRSVKIN